MASRPRRARVSRTRGAVARMPQACNLRGKALEGDWKRYKCCQEQCCYKRLCCQTCEKNCPQCTMCCEAVLCLGLAVSSTKNHVQQERQIQTDPCDNRLIAFSNCLMILSCTSAPSPTL